MIPIDGDLYEMNGILIRFSDAIRNDFASSINTTILSTRIHLVLCACLMQSAGSGQEETDRADL